MRIRVLDIESGRTELVDQSPIWMAHGGLQNLDLRWSPNSRWLAYSRGLESGNAAIFLYDAEENELHQATSGFYQDMQPVFDPDGKYLYFLTNRTFRPVYGDFDGS